MSPKSLLKSKTFWLNLAQVALPFAVPAAQEFIVQHPQVAAGLSAGVNIANRLLTKAPVTILPR